MIKVTFQSDQSNPKEEEHQRHKQHQNHCILDVHKNQLLKCLGLKHLVEMHHCYILQVKLIEASNVDKKKK